MKILAIDTSTMSTTVAISEDEEILAEFTLRGQISHSETLVDMVENIFEKMNFSIADIDLYAVGVGPGSFTGLRIGLSAAKTFAQTLNKKIIGVSSLKSVAYNISEDAIIVPIIDARRNRVYRGIYKKMDKEIHQLKPDALVEINMLNKELEQYNKIIFTGDGIDTVKSVLEETFGNRAVFAAENIKRVRGGSFCLCALEEFRCKKEHSYYDLVPNYANESQAQREYDNENKAKKC